MARSCRNAVCNAGELIGLLNLGPHLSQQEDAADDRAPLANLAGQIAPTLAGWRRAAHDRPAREVGGFYDFLALPFDRLGITSAA